MCSATDTTFAHYSTDLPVGLEQRLFLTTACPGAVLYREPSAKRDRERWCRPTAEEQFSSGSMAQPSISKTPPWNHKQGTKGKKKSQGLVFWPSVRR